MSLVAVTWAAAALLTVDVGSVPNAETAALKAAALSTKPWPCNADTRLQKKSRVLQKNLEQRLAKAGFGYSLRRHRLSVAVVDLSRADTTYYAGVNDDDMMYAASLPKIAILLAVAQAAHDGQLTWTSQYDRRLSEMITESNNHDAVWGAEQVGLWGIGEVLRDPRYCFYDNVHGGLWVGKHYGPAGASLREPLKDLSHAATARQAARYYTMLNAGELVSKEWSQHMLRLMGPPAINHKFVAGLRGRSDVKFLARKSGTWRTWHADSALIQHGDERYVVVALSELRSGERVLEQLARVVDDLIMEGKHRPAKQPHS